MNEKIKQLLDILLQQKSYLTALQLSEMLGVTERSIRNYVRILNSSETQDPLIVSSNKAIGFNAICILKVSRIASLLKTMLTCFSKLP